jgi:hypothetical protein
MKKNNNLIEVCEKSELLNKRKIIEVADTKKSN